MVAHALVADLEKFLRMKAFRITELFDTPEESTIHKLLWEIVSRSQSLCNNYLSEGALQAEIEATFRALNFGRGEPYEVECEDPKETESLVVKRVNQTGQVEAVILLEFKRAQRN